MTFKSFLPGLIWFIISVVLLVLPNNDLPHTRYFDIPFFDKYVHFTMFFLLTSLFTFPFSFLHTEKAVIKSWFTRITLFVIVYGILMEFVQKFMTIDRSFDLIDILFDGLGSIAGLLTVSFYYNNKIGPNRNRGRNQ